MIMIMLQICEDIDGTVIEIIVEANADELLMLIELRRELLLSNFIFNFNFQKKLFYFQVSANSPLSLLPNEGDRLVYSNTRLMFWST